VEPELCPIPSYHEVMARVPEGHVCTLLRLESHPLFWPAAINEEDRYKTAFFTPGADMRCVHACTPPPFLCAKRHASHTMQLVVKVHQYKSLTVRSLMSICNSHIPSGMEKLDGPLVLPPTACVR
jgi:hypothetical protein